MWKTLDDRPPADLLADAVVRMRHVATVLNELSRIENLPAEEYPDGAMILAADMRALSEFVLEEAKQAATRPTPDDPEWAVARRWVALAAGALPLPLESDAIAAVPTEFKHAELALTSAASNMTWLLAEGEQRGVPPRLHGISYGRLRAMANTTSAVLESRSRGLRVELERVSRQPLPAQAGLNDEQREARDGFEAVRVGALELASVGKRWPAERMRARLEPIQVRKRGDKLASRYWDAATGLQEAIDSGFYGAAMEDRVAEADAAAWEARYELSSFLVVDSGAEPVSLTI